jgi:hypothetical protein
MEPPLLHLFQEFAYLDRIGDKEHLSHQFSEDKRLLCPDLPRNIFLIDDTDDVVDMVLVNGIP